MDVLNETLITLCWELYQQGLPKARIAQRLSKNRETVIRWIQGIEKEGLIDFLDVYRQAKKVERKTRQTDPIVKRLIWDIREREFDCCGQKIQYFLEKERGIHLSVPKIYEILAEKYVIRPKWQKNKHRGEVPKATGPREVVQMDTIDFGELYAFTAVDIFTREADVFLTTELTGECGKEFLFRSIRERFNGFVRIIQTDGGSEFKAEFTDNVYQFCERHRVSNPYRKNEQAYIESFNRSVRKECLGWNTYRSNELENCQAMADDFILRYHYHRPHMGLGMVPPLLRKESDCRISTEN
jgi:transposase InsO family protein